jgi:hypothetical protein
MSLTAFVALQNLAGGFVMLEKMFIFYLYYQLRSALRSLPSPPVKREMKCIKNRKDAKKTSQLCKHFIEKERK